MNCINIMTITFVICLCLVTGDNYFKNLDQCTGPRIRNSWTELDYNQRQQFVRLVLRLKSYTEAWKFGSNVKRPLYDIFVRVHTDPISTELWHGTSVFLSAHKYYLWMFESALIYIGLSEGPGMYPPITDACSIALPYWDWERDFDDNPNDKDCPVRHSSIWESNLFGESQLKSPYYVNTGTFAWWELVYPVSSNPYRVMSQTEPNYNTRLKRWLNCTSNDAALTTGPAQLMYSIVSYPLFRNISVFLTGGPHRAIHQYVGFSMSTMMSPDDPLFFLHHCNIDRLYHIWIDCHDYEKIDAENLTNVQYESANPLLPGSTWLKLDPYTRLPFDVGIDVPISYLSDGEENKLFPMDSWPTPRQLWALGKKNNRGPGDLYYRYGPDKLVTTLGDVCEENTKWNWVNYGESNLDDDDLFYKKISDTWKENLNNSVKSKVDVLFDMAMTECQKTPKLEITDYVMNWLISNGLDVSVLDTICEKHQNFTYDLEPVPTEPPTEPSSIVQREELLFESVNEISSTAYSTFMHQPFWFIISSLAICVLLLSFFLILLVLLVRYNPSISQYSLFEKEIV